LAAERDAEILVLDVCGRGGAAAGWYVVSIFTLFSALTIVSRQSMYSTPRYVAQPTVVALHKLTIFQAHPLPVFRPSIRPMFSL
jgi:hypothetical protein